MSADSTFQIRELRQSDLDQVVTIERNVFQSPWSRKSFQDSIESGALNWVVIVDNVIAGYSVNLAVADEFHILNIAIVECFRRRGFAAALLQHSLDAAQNRGLSDVFLEVRVSNNSAIALYKKFGFEDMMKRKKYYPDGEDAFVMHLALATQPPLETETLIRRSSTDGY